LLADCGDKSAREEPAPLRGSSGGRGDARDAGTESSSIKEKESTVDELKKMIGCKNKFVAAFTT
jgi:hypothetical protein